MSLTNRQIRATLAVAVFGSLSSTLSAYNDGRTFALGVERARMHGWLRESVDEWIANRPGRGRRRKDT